MRVPLGIVKFDGWSGVSFLIGSLKSRNPRKIIDVWA